MTDSRKVLIVGPGDALSVGNEAVDVIVRSDVRQSVVIGHDWALDILPSLSEPYTGLFGRKPQAGGVHRPKAMRMTASRDRSRAKVKAGRKANVARIRS